MVKNHRAILIANVRSLAIQCRWVVIRPENIQQPIVTDDGRIEFHLHHFGVSGAVATDVFVSWVLGFAAGVSDRGILYSRHRAEGRFDSPETARAEGSLFCRHGWTIRREAKPRKAAE